MGGAPSTTFSYSVPKRPNNHPDSQWNPSSRDDSDCCILPLPRSTSSSDTMSVSMALPIPRHVDAADVMASRPTCGQPQHAVRSSPQLAPWLPSPDQSAYIDRGSTENYYTKRQVLPVINNLANEIIACFAVSSLAEIRAYTAGDDDEQSQAYRTRRDLFIESRLVYVQGKLFIAPDDFQEYTLAQQEILRKVNKATLVLSIFENYQSSLFQIDEHFVDTFVLPGHKLLLWHGAILLELKTQAYIASLSDPDILPNRNLDVLFPNNLDAILVARHPDTPLLAPSEVDFVHRARARKQYLQAEPLRTARTVLPVRYAWQDFVRSFAVSMAKNIDSLLDNAPSHGHQHQQQQGVRATFGIRASQVDNGQTRKTGVGSIASIMNDDDVTSSPQVKIESRSYPGARAPPKYGDSSSFPSSRRSEEPTRRVTVRSTTTTTVNARQVWSVAEEDALMSGLTRVGGPYWSQILSFYGRGGSVSEVLKDRNQVQLKDKARNLKLWYLKSSNGDAEKVPECLRSVTGELRKRASKARLDQAAGKQSQGQTFRTVADYSSSMRPPSNGSRTTVSPGPQQSSNNGARLSSSSYAPPTGRLSYSPSAQRLPSCDSFDVRSSSPPPRKRSRQSID